MNNKQKTVLALGGLAVVGVLVYFRNEIKSIVTRGYINKNPGNIEKTFDTKGNQTFWTGEVTGTDNRFKSFSSMPYGYRAILINLQSYINKAGFNTIEKMIDAWAPPGENNTEGYKQRVSTETGLDRSVPVSPSDLKTLSSIAAAISQVENGIPADRNDIVAGTKLL